MPRIRKAGRESTKLKEFAIGWSRRRHRRPEWEIDAAFQIRELASLVADTSVHNILLSWIFTWPFFFLLFLGYSVISLNFRVGVGTVCETKKNIFFSSTQKEMAKKFRRRYTDSFSLFFFWRHQLNGKLWIWKGVGRSGSTRHTTRDSSPYRRTHPFYLPLFSSACVSMLARQTGRKRESNGVWF